MASQSRLIDHYSLLGVGRNATSDQISQAFRRRAKQLHPDVNKSFEAGQAFLLLSEAYYVLRDPGRRHTFDVFLYNEMRADRPGRARRRRLQAWAAAFALVGMVGAVTFTFDALDTTDPVAETKAGRSASAEGPAQGDAPMPQRVVVAEMTSADEPQSQRPKPEDPGPSGAPASLGDFQSTVAPEDRPLITAPDIIDDVPVADDQAADIPAPGMAVKPASRHAAAIMRRPPAVLVHMAHHARIYIARASRTWTSAKRRHLAHPATKRRYASL